MKKNLKVLLVKPPQKVNEVQPPLGLGYLASTIRNFTDVKILDCIKENLSILGYKKYLCGKNFDVIGFQCYTVDISTVKKMSEITKKILPNAILLVGGPQPSLNPINTMGYLIDIKYGFKGEAEIGFPKLIMFIKKNKLLKKNIRKIPGIIYRWDNKIYVNENKLLENLDQVRPSWDLFDIKNYPLAPHGAFCKQYPTAPLIVTRGCPFFCTYCGAPIISGRKIRSHSVDYVIAQIEFLNKEYGIREIHIEDDNFTLKKEFVVKFCNELIKKNLGITWTCPNGIRIDTLDSEVVELMKKSGLYSVSVGIESGSDKIRKLMGKNLPTKIIKEKVKMIRKAGLEVIGFFILGYPGESIEDINKTINFACSLDLKRAGFSAFKPFPGTPIYDMLVKDNKICPSKLNLDNFSLDKVVWSPEGINHKKLKNLRQKAFLKFYLRPKIIWKMLREIKNFQNFLFVIRRMYRWLT